MELGVHLPQFGPFASGRAVIRFARLAEELGFHSVWCSDHVVLPVTFEPRYPYDPEGRFGATHELPCLEALTTMTFAAGATERIKLGSSVLVVPYRHPVLLGSQLSALQVLSGGRVILGAGAGWMAEEFEALNIPYRDRGARFDECLDLVMTMCSQSPAEFHGRFYDLPPAGTLPVPEVLPEVWIGGHSRRALERAGRFGGWHAFHLGPAEVAEIVDDLPEETTISVRHKVAPDLSSLADELHAFAEVGVDHVLLDIWGDERTIERSWEQIAEAHLG